MFGYPSPPAAVKSFVATVYVAAPEMSTGPPSQAPLAVCRFTSLTLLPTGDEMSYVKQSPDTCGKRPSAPGILETPFSSAAFSSRPVMVAVVTMLPNGSTASTCPRVISHGGGVLAGQKPLPPPAAAQVS